MLLLFLYNAERQVSSIQNDNAHHLLDTVTLAVENEYKSLLFHKASSLEKRKHELKNIITIAMIFVEDLQKKAENGLPAEVEAKKLATEGILRMRFDDNVGYIWINDMARPIPTMIMHPTIPEQDGQVLDDPKFNCVGGTKKEPSQGFWRGMRRPRSWLC